jgi:hypothetical protein
VLKRQINSGRQEGRRDDEAADLRVEARAGPRVVVQDYAAHVADCLAQAAEAHGDHEGPCFELEALDELDGEEDAEGAAEEGVHGEGGVVAVDCLVDWAQGGDGGAVLGGFLVGDGDRGVERHCGGGGARGGTCCRGGWRLDGEMLEVEGLE